MSDEVDDLLRGAMKTLDGEVPSGYFEALPNRTLARLEASSMQMGTESNVDETNPVMMQGIPLADEATRTEDPSVPARPSQPPREEDSGLHDIRSLASSTKLRLSKKMTAVQPEEDILASSSAGWKAVALPEPARMVSLPELAELPVGSEVEPKRSRRESKRQMQEAAAAAAAAPVVSAIATTPVISGPSAAVATSMPAFGSGMLAKQPKTRNRAGLFTAVGLGLAAAAGAVIFVSTKDKSTPAQEAAPAPQQAAAVKPTVESIEPAAATATGAADTGAAAAPAPEAPAAIAAAPVEPAPTEAKAADVEEKRLSRGKAAKVATKEKTELDLSKDQAKSPTKSKPEKPTTVGGTTPTKEQENEQSFDDLLKEAGVKDSKKADKPVLEKKSLSSDDIRKGMASVQSKAQACYAGTQGTASVKLTVAPSGEVTKATVSGVFAGTPVGACVASAVKSISFPPWDGGPQSVNYSYLLAE